MVRTSTTVAGVVVGLVVVGAALHDARLDAAGPAAGAHAKRVPAPHGQQPSPSTSSSGSAERALLAKYCVTCHNERLKTGSLALDQADLDNVSHSAAVWEKVVKKVRSGAMPPAGLPRPEPAMLTALVNELEAALDRAAAANPNPGRPAPVHRLNRAEYTNAVRDLLAVEIDARALLPADDSGYGFDNIGDVLSVSPGLLERYMLAGAKISRLALGDPTLRAATATYKASPLLLQDDRMSEDLPFGSRGGMAVRHAFPLDAEYAIRIGLQGPADQQQVEVRIDRERVKLFTLGAGRERGGLEVRVPVKAGTRLVGAAFVGTLDRTLPIDGRPARLPITSFEFSQSGVSTIQIVGPFNGHVPEETASRRQIFVCYPATSSERTGASARGNDEKACAKKILATLARRAYRRPVTDRDVQPLLASFEIGRSKGGFETGIKLGIQDILVSPKFLFRIAQDPARVTPGTPYRLGDLELASRLSFFLWSSLPDEELIEAAERGKLKDPAVVADQGRRMLADPKSKALVTNFAGQWLYLRNLRMAAPNATLFPEFDDNLREAFQRETELFVESQLREDHGLVGMLTANYTFVNERLAEHYGIPNVYGSHFRRVTLEGDRRAGLLGQASILTVTSYPNRTSPVVRGKWLLENLLGAPPPPPPPNVPALKESGEGGRPTTVRERLEQHRKNPVCASCHAQMDPLGFALENFDAIGRWRTVDGESNAPIDSSGSLPSGAKFQGPAEFRNVLLTRRMDFVRTVTEKLLTYALGRGLEYYDAPAVRQILRDAAPSDYRWSTIIQAIVKSTPFQMRVATDSTSVKAALDTPSR